MESSRQTARKALIDIAGRDRYEHLIRSLGEYAREESPRLRYWHESLLSKLADATGISIVDFSGAQDALLVCHIHNEPLQWLDGLMVKGFPPTSADYLAAEEQLFPHSHEVEFGRLPNQAGKASGVFSCQSCIKARRQWAGQLPNNSFKPKPLRGSA